MPSTTPEQVLAQGLSELGLDPPADVLDALATLARELEAWGSKINLTGHRDAETITRRLVLDAATVLVRLPLFDSLADLGSGAGFPGLPMAILDPSRRFVLVESRERRHFFQRQMIRQLGLENVVAIRGRFDELEPERCQAVIAQAVATPAALVDAMLRWVTPGGLLVVPGGMLHREVPLDQRFHGAHSLEYEVPLLGPRRTIWVARDARDPGR